MQIEQSCRLRVYSDDSDKIDGVVVYEWLVKQAHSHGLRGATVLRGVMGYGGHGVVHTSKVFALAADLPVVVEIIDDRASLESFATEISANISNGLLSLENIEAVHFKSTAG
jgi:PII-like signaling protein